MKRFAAIALSLTLLPLNHVGIAQEVGDTSPDNSVIASLRQVREIQLFLGDDEDGPRWDLVMAFYGGAYICESIGARDAGKSSVLIKQAKAQKSKIPAEVIRLKWTGRAFSGLGLAALVTATVLLGCSLKDQMAKSNYEVSHEDIMLNKLSGVFNFDLTFINLNDSEAVSRIPTEVIFLVQDPEVRKAIAEMHEDLP